MNTPTPNNPAPPEWAVKAAEEVIFLGKPDNYEVSTSQIKRKAAIIAKHATAAGAPPRMNRERFFAAHENATLADWAEYQRHADLDHAPAAVADAGQLRERIAQLLAARFAHCSPRYYEDMADRILAMLPTAPAVAPAACFWPSGCSDKKRCAAFKGCVADAQNKAARLARECFAPAAGQHGELAELVAELDAAKRKESPTK